MIGGRQCIVLIVDLFQSLVHTILRHVPDFSGEKTLAAGSSARARAIYRLTGGDTGRQDLHFWLTLNSLHLQFLYL